MNFLEIHHSLYALQAAALVNEPSVLINHPFEGDILTAKELVYVEAVWTGNR